MRIVVTGANGFLGRATVRALCAAGHEVVSVTRRRTEALPDDRSVVLPDQTALEGWRPLVENADAVVHLVAHTHQGEHTGPTARAEFRRVNVEVTRALATACRQARVSRVVYVSSAKVYGECSLQDASGVIKAFRAESPVAPVGPYGASKLEAEHLLSQELNGATLSILRPPLIYGPGMRGNLLSLLRVVARQAPLPFSTLDNRRSLVHRSSVVAAIGCCLQQPSPQPGTQVFTLSDLTVSTPELVRIMAGGLGLSARLFPLPIAVLRAFGKLSGRVAQVDRLVSSFVIDGDVATHALELPKPPGVEAAWQEIARVFRADKGAWQCA